MLKALIAGEQAPEQLTDLAQRRLRRKRAALGEALTARKILRVLYRGRYATVRGAGQRLGPDSEGLSGTVLQPTSTPSLHPATLPREIFMRRG